MRQQGTSRRSPENSTSDPASENSALCSFWLSGNCQYGEHCSFEHDEQKRPEQRDGEGPGFVHPKYRTQLCCYWLKGRCEYGKSCNFLHQKPEDDSLGDVGPKNAQKPQAECHFFSQGFCRYGDRCVHLHTARTSPASGSGVSVGRRRSGAGSGRQSRQSSRHSPGPSPRPSLVLPIGLQPPSGKHKLQCHGLSSPGPREEGDEDGAPGKTRSRRGEGEAQPPRANISLPDLSPNKSKGDRKVKRKPRGGEEDQMANKSSGSPLPSYEGEKAPSPGKQLGSDSPAQNKEMKKQQPGRAAKSTELPLPEIVGVMRHSNSQDAPPKPLITTAPAPVKPSSVVKATEIPLTPAAGNSLPTSAKQKINNNSRLTLPPKETPSGLANATKSSLQASPIKVKPTHVVAGAVNPPDRNLTLQVPSASKGPSVQLQLLANPTKKSNASQLPATSFQNPTTKIPGKLAGAQPVAENSRSVPRKPSLQAGPSTPIAVPNLVSPDKLKRNSRVPSNSEVVAPGGLGVKPGQDASECTNLNNAVGGDPNPSPSPKQNPQHSGPRLDSDLTQSSPRASGSTVGSTDGIPSSAMGSPASSPSLSPPLAPPGHLFTPLRGHFQRAVGTSAPISYPSDSPAAKTWPRSREASRGGSGMAPSSFHWESESAGEGNLVFAGSGGNGNGCGVIGLRSGSSRESSRKSSSALDSLNSSMAPGPSGGLGSRKGSSAGLLEGSQSRRSSVFLDDTDPVAPPKHAHSATIVRKNSNFGNASFDSAGGGGSLKQMFSPVVGASAASASALSAVSFANAESILSPSGSGHDAPNASPKNNNNSNNNDSNNSINNSQHSGNDNESKAPQGYAFQANSWGSEDVASIAAENNEGSNQSNANVSGHNNGSGNTIGNANANPIGNGRRTSGSGSSGLGLGPATPNPPNGLWVLSSLCRIAENMADAAAQAEHGVEEQADSEPAESSELGRGKARATPPAKSTTAALQERLQERLQSNASTEHLVHPFDNIYAAKSPLFPALPSNLGSAGTLNLDAPNIVTPRGGTEGKKLEFCDDEDEAYVEDKADTMSTSGSAPAPGGVAFASHQTNNPYADLKHAEEDVSLEPSVHQFLTVHTVHNSGSGNMGNMGNGPGGGNLGVGLGAMYGPGMLPLFRGNGGMHQHFFPPDQGPGKARGPNRGYFPLEHGHPHLHPHHGGHLQRPHAQHAQHAQQHDMELYPAYAGVDPNCGGTGGGVMRSLRGPPVHPHFPLAGSPVARAGGNRLLPGIHHPHVPFSHVSLYEGSYEGSYPNGPGGHHLGRDGGQPVMRKGNMEADELAGMNGFTGLPRGGFATNGNGLSPFESQFDPRFPGHFDRRYEATFDQCP